MKIIHHTHIEDRLMQLCYRGVCYRKKPCNLEIMQGKIVGLYRGLPWHRQHLQKPFIPQSIAQLKYRGIDYFCVVSSEQVEHKPEVNSIKSV